MDREMPDRRVDTLPGRASRAAAGWLPLLGVCLAASCSDVRVVAVEIAVIELEPTGASILVGGSVQFQARLLDGSGNVLSGRDINWSSSDPETAPVDGTGLVHGAAAGQATITAASAEWQATADVAVNRPAPQLTSIQPSAGQRLRTLDLVLTGANFQEGVTTVDLGSGIVIDAVTVTAPGSMTVRVTIDRGAALGARAISVTNPAPGGGTATLAGGFTVVAEHPTPTVTGASPAEGQRQQTLNVTLAGTGFVQSLTTVGFGPGISVETIEVGTPASLTARISVAGDAALGTRDVTVTNPAPGGGTATLAGGFTVKAANPRPTATGVSPAEGQRTTTLDVTLTGSGFLAGVTTVSFGSNVTVNNVTVRSGTALTANISIGAGAALGARNVSVANPPPGGGSATLPAGFTVLPVHPAPDIGSASPDAVQRRDELDVTLTGSGFLPGLTTVTFGPDITVNDVTVVGPASLTANIRIGSGAALGSRDISVSNPAPGGGTVALKDGITILEENPAPTVTDALPDSGIRGTALTVVLLGSGFVQGLTSVSFGEDITVNSVTVVFWTSLSVNITIGSTASPGRRDVAVTNAAPGGGTFIMRNGFLVQAGGGN
jgi:hypothetical protein